MSAASRLRYLYLGYLSKPKAQRPLYRLIRRHRPRTIVEIGISDAQRAVRLIAVAQRFAADQKVCYTGIDPFEAAPEPERNLTLKEAYRRLSATGANVRLEPGNPQWALARAANSLTGTDMLLISAEQDLESVAAAWFYIPRMLHADSLVLVEETTNDAQTAIRSMSRVEIMQLARRQKGRLAA